jgi:hypothetical protein
MTEALVVGGTVGSGSVVHKMSAVGVNPGGSGTSACGKQVTRCHGWLGTQEWRAASIERGAGVKPCRECSRFDVRVTFVKVTG